jgi:DNA replication protein DnaC
MERLEDVLKRLGIGTLTPLTATVDEADATEPPCPICRGSGYICYDVPRDHPDFGRAVPCRCRTEEISVARRSKLERLSNLGALTRHRFDNLIADGRNPESPDHRHRFKVAVTTAQAFAAAPQGWLILVGPPGCGKTHLAAAIANARIEHGESAFFVVVPDLLDHLRGAYSPTSEITYDDLFENVRTAPLLVLDDLGTQSSTPWAMEKLYQLFNSRYNNQLPTVVTTNHSLEDVDERLRVRLTDPDFSRICYLQPPQSAAFQRLGGTLDLLRHMTFESFAPDGRNLASQQVESLRAAFQAAVLYAASPEGWLVLHGGYGCGKTHLAAAIANHRLGENRPATFVSVPDLLDHLRSTYGPDSPVTYDQLFEEIRTTQLLILDDLGTQSATAWAEEKLYQLFNYRYNARLPTVITTNLSIDDLEPRVASRLSDPNLLYMEQIFDIDAPDYRRPDGGRRTGSPRRPPQQPKSRSRG